VQAPHKSGGPLALAAKRLELVRELVPTATRISMLVNPAGPNSESALIEAQSAGRAIGLETHILRASTSREINEAFATFVREPPDAVFVDIKVVGALASDTHRHARIRADEVIE
jgi:ABC-type uncharacterized transport system substrate-binding protein